MGPNKNNNNLDGSPQWVAVHAMGKGEGVAGDGTEKHVETVAPGLPHADHLHLEKPTTNIMPSIYTRNKLNIIYLIINKIILLITYSYQ